MADLQAALSEAVKLNRSITQFLKFSTYPDYDDLSGLDIDFSDGEQLLLWEELRRITDKLADVEEYISYLTRPITEVSRLRKGTAGKYQTAKGRWTAILIGVGCSIEARKPGASSPNAALLPLRECDDIPSRYEIPAKAVTVTTEKAGEVYYFEPNRIVLFYQDAEISGDYTLVGHFDATEDFVSAVENNPVLEGWGNKIVQISAEN